MGPNLELIRGLFVDVHRLVHGKLFNSGWKRNRACDTRACALRSFHDFVGRAVDRTMVEGPESDADFLVHQFIEKIGRSLRLCGRASARQFVHQLIGDGFKAAGLHGE